MILVFDPECKTEYAKRPFKQKGQEDDFFSFFLRVFLCPLCPSGLPGSLVLLVPGHPAPEPAVGNTF